jgi:hypothetical protein
VLVELGVVQPDRREPGEVGDHVEGTGDVRGVRQAQAWRGAGVNTWPTASASSPIS